MIEIASVIASIWILIGFRILYGACRNPDWTPEVGAKAKQENKFITIRLLLFAIAFVAFCLPGPLLLAFVPVRDMIKENDPKLAQWILSNKKES